jgi:serine/threonine protein kinase
MPSPTSVDELLDLIQKSGVVEEKRLTAYMDRLRDNSALPADPNKLADGMVRDGLITGFQSEQILLGKWRRFHIGKYRVLERLGSGGMGIVYLCEHKLMRRRVAVKVLPSVKAEDPATLERFYREARAVAALDHPNIVRAYDIDQDENLHFLVMEHVDGASLQDIIKKVGPLDSIRAAHYMRQAALGLQHAHEAANLVHRDIKPGNVLVDRNGIVKILDMGLARFFNDTEDILTKKYDENVLGTADYLAPEQALDSHSVDIRADIYSLGATFYFTLTGRTPFAEGTVAQKLIWHQTRQPKAIRSIRPEVPEGLVAVIDRMMAKDPSQRYQTPLGVAEALAPWTQTPIALPPDAEMPQLSPAAMGAAPGEVNAVAGARKPLNGELSPPPSSRRQWQVAANTPAASVPLFAPPPATPAVAARPSGAAVPTVTPVAPQAKPPAAVPEARATAPVPARPVAPAARPSAPPIVVPRKPAAPPAAAPRAKSWKKSAAETEVASSRGDTPTAPARSKTTRHHASTFREIRSDRRLFWWLVVSGTALAIALGVVIWKLI